MAGQRLKKEPSGGMKKGPVIAAAAVAVVAAAYVGLCAWAGGQSTVMPNVSVAGVDVSGMTAQQVEAAVKDQVSQWDADTVVTLTYGEFSGTLTASDLLRTEDGLGQSAVSAGRENFLTSGAQYIRHLLGGSTHLDAAFDKADTAAHPAVEALLDAAELQVGGSVEQMSYQVDGNDLSVTKGRTGLAFDREKVFDLAYDVACQSMTQVITEQKAVEATIDLAAEDVVTETTPDEPDFDAIHDAVYTEAKSAEMDATTHAVTDHTVGVDFDVSALKTAYDAAAEGETFSIPLTLTMPKDTKSELESKLFRDVLGQGTTKVSGSANRKSNVKLSAQACNGVILLPGEVFSYNSTTGSRTAEKGYLPAPVYSGSASVDEVGGGICQTSSTIYYAVLHTELKVVERAAHRYNTGYVDPGMDATVYYGSTDFRFENSTNYPIKIVTESYDSGGNRYLSVKIYGTNETGNYAVPKSTTYDTITPTTQYKADSSIPQGTTQVDTKQNPYTGLKAQTYRYIYNKAGTLLETQDMGVSSYKMRPKTIYYNPADGDPSTWTNGEPPKASSAETTQPAQSDNSEQEVEIQLPTVPDTGSSAENQTEQESSGQEETSSEQETAV